MEGRPRSSGIRTGAEYSLHSTMETSACGSATTPQTLSSCKQAFKAQSFVSSLPKQNVFPEPGITDCGGRQGSIEILGRKWRPGKVK